MFHLISYHKLRNMNEFLKNPGADVVWEEVGSTNLVHLLGGFKPCLRLSGPKALSATDLDLSLLQLAGAGSDLEGRDACCGVS